MRLPPASGSFVQQALASTLAVLLTGGSLTASPALALTDSKAIASCIFTKAPGSLARCVVDPTCLANLACINTCTNRPDESECQIKCGDEFSNQVVGDFTKAVVSDNKCVPQRQDDGSWPVPKDAALVKKFTADQFTGDWYISAGLNPAFDIFDCQLHKFEAPSPTQLVGNLQWRIKDPLAGTAFVTRYTVQTFEQDKTRPGIWYNHDNDFLHYEDDWYILDAKPDKYVVVYYRGNNDAWDGYGGAVVYTKAAALPREFVPEITKAVEKIGLKWSDFVLTDNTCAARESRLQEFEEDLVFLETKAARGITLVGKEIQKDVVLVEQEIVKDAVKIEQEIEKDAKQLFNFRR